MFVYLAGYLRHFWLYELLFLANKVKISLFFFYMFLNSSIVYPAAIVQNLSELEIKVVFIPSPFSWPVVRSLLPVSFISQCSILATQIPVLRTSVIITSVFFKKMKYGAVSSV